MASASAVVEKLPQLPPHVQREHPRQKRPSSGKYRAKSVTYSDAHIGILPGAVSDFESRDPNT